MAAVAAGLLAACGGGYYLLCVWSAFRFLGVSRRQLEEFAPPVSILKPLRGTDPGMYEAFRSHCLQDYPAYELLFGVADRNDPSAALVERLKGEFPRRRIELVLCPLRPGANGKVGSLLQLLPQARYNHLLINDSDIRVPGNYLRTVMSPFAQPEVGMVTAPYRGAAAGTLGSKLEALAISTDFFPSVLTARALEGIRFGLGSTLAISRHALEVIGGFAPLLDYLADDYELGARISRAGFKVVLSDTVVDTHLPGYSLAGFWSHQLRWARTIRDSRKAGYSGLVLTFGLPWAMLAALLAKGAPWSLAVLLLTLLLRLAVAIVAGRIVLQDEQIPRDLWLLPLRDVLGLLLWGASFLGHTVSWRGEHFRLRDGKLIPLD